MYKKPLITVLNKIYTPTNAIYQGKGKVYTYEVPQGLTSKQRETLDKSGFELNKISTYHHDQTVNKLREIVLDKDLEKKVIHLFLRAIGKAEIRGLQSIYSYYFTRSLPAHKFSPFHQEGFKNDTEQNDSKELFNLYTGYTSYTGCSTLLLDL
ncbi:MAG: hypothetical protein OIF32_12580 [Campylobacterales bacterium]|nr:hypothetical protein [Campylobacterales bacterium]